jgi:hypothetical protein
MAATMIIEHILNLDSTAIFTTRDVLQYGTRSAVDQCLHRLVKSSFIFRLARGVFVRDRNAQITIDEIARTKAVAFGRRILDHATRILSELKVKKPLEHPQNLDHEIDIEPRRQQTVYSHTNTFAIDGHSSRFQSVLGPIEYHGIAPRKVKLSKTKAGRKVYGLWYFGEDDRIAPAIKAACRDLSRTDRIDLRRGSAFMPAWLHHFMLQRYASSITNERFAA